MGGRVWVSIGCRLVGVRKSMGGRVGVGRGWEMDMTRIKVSVSREEMEMEERRIMLVMGRDKGKSQQHEAGLSADGAGKGCVKADGMPPMYGGGY